MLPITANPPMCIVSLLPGRQLAAIANMPLAAIAKPWVSIQLPMPFGKLSQWTATAENYAAQGPWHLLPRPRAITKWHMSVVGNALSMS